MTTASVLHYPASVLPTSDQKRSGSTIIRLVDSERCSFPQLRRPHKPHISLTNFAELINQTPFQKFSSKPSLETKRNSMSPTHRSGFLPPEFGSLSQLKENQSKKHFSARNSKTFGNLSPSMRKSRFLEESLRRQSSVQFQIDE